MSPPDDEKKENGIEKRRISWVDILQSAGFMAMVLFLFNLNHGAGQNRDAKIDSNKTEISDIKTQQLLDKQEFNHKLDKLLYIQEKENPDHAKEFDENNQLKLKVIWLPDSAGEGFIPYIEDSLGETHKATIDSLGNVIPIDQ